MKIKKAERIQAFCAKQNPAKTNKRISADSLTTSKTFRDFAELR
jgi:hypothetical protein